MSPDTLYYMTMPYIHWLRMKVERTLSCGNVKFRKEEYKQSGKIHPTKAAALTSLVKGEVAIRVAKYDDFWHFMLIKKFVQNSMHKEE